MTPSDWPPIVDEIDQELAERNACVFITDVLSSTRHPRADLGEIQVQLAQELVELRTRLQAGACGSWERFQYVEKDLCLKELSARKVYGFIKQQIEKGWSHGAEHIRKDLARALAGKRRSGATKVEILLVEYLCDAALLICRKVKQINPNAKV